MGATWTKYLMDVSVICAGAFYPMEVAGRA